MTRRDIFKLLPATSAAPGLLLGARRPAGDKPNLLFLWTDQQRADTMGAYGNPRYRVPNMNRLAAESVVFDRAYVTQPVCTPSRSSVLTGLWPHQNGCVRNNIALRREAKTLPELLADSAYRTGYFGKWHLGDEIFPQRGFEEWAAIEDGIYRNFYSPGRDRNARSGYHQFMANLGYKPDDAKNNDFTRRFATKLPLEHTKPSFLANEASRFILKHRNEPWLLHVNFLEPHTPFSSVLNDLHEAEEAPPPKNFPGVPESGEPEWYKRRRADFVKRGIEGLPLSDESGWRRVQRNYAGLCSLVDQAVGRILWALQASGVMDNTIIVYTSDHGEMMGSHMLSAKQVMYEEACRVPYLLRVPFRNQRSMRFRPPVSHIDFVPTLLDLMGKKEAAAGLPGQSLIPALEGTARRDGDVFLEWTSESEKAGPNARTAITEDGWKLVLHDTDRSMLFDHNRDPLEMNNLYGMPAAAAQTARLRKKIEAWQQQTGDTFRA